MQNKKNKYLIFGGSGSLGTTLINRLYKDNSICVYSRDESKHWNIKNKFQSPNLSFQVGDIRDYSRVEECIKRYNPNYIIIASALKHVDVCELSPKESVLTNVTGPQNVVDAVENNLEKLKLLKKVLMVSTDKACSPINVYGMCKATAERIVLEKSRHIKSVVFCATRYGNVLESRGSVIPLFNHQALHNKYITVTDDRMTRFLMTLNDSADLIFNALENAEPGETYAPKLQSMKIIDLANIYSTKYNKPIKITGIRPGEKIHESLINETEWMRTRKSDDTNTYIIKPIYDCNIFTTDSYDYNSSADNFSKEELLGYLTKLNYIK